jgi:hypothetical protein
VGLSRSGDEEEGDMLLTDCPDATPGVRAGTSSSNELEALLVEEYCGLVDVTPLKKGIDKANPPASTRKAQPRELSVDVNDVMARKSRPQGLLSTAVPLPCESAVN